MKNIFLEQIVPLIPLMLLICIPTIGYFINEFAHYPFIKKHYEKYIGETKKTKTKSADYSTQKVYELLEEYYNKFDKEQKKYEKANLRVKVSGVNSVISFILGLIASTLVSIVILFLPGISDIMIIPVSIGITLLMFAVVGITVLYIDFSTKGEFYEICLTVLEEEAVSS